MTDLTWHRLFWGVHYTNGPDTSYLVGTGWDWRRKRDVPDTEPTRPLLFQTRQQARDWCRDQNTIERGPGFGGHFRPVRVYERVSPHST